MTPSLTLSPMHHHAKALDTVSGRKRKLSEGDDYSDTESASSPKSLSPSLDDDRRQHHNDLERKRREHIKGAFSQLKDALPMNDGEKPSRAHILRKACDELNRRKHVDEENRRLKEELLRMQKENEVLKAQPNPYSTHGLIGIKPQEPQLPTALSVGVPSTSAVNALSYPTMSISTADSFSMEPRLSLDSLAFKTQPSILSTAGQLDLLSLLNQNILQQKLQQIQLPQIQQPTPVKPSFNDFQAHLLAAGLRN
ncbi:hypothetical protein QR680_018728 [Steinernema hermaphroditum]|uniref:BHLH domain-containing protein n=1 Tax=Steinernema hermaphroditum TaxID=289476 RepID=A0AA39HK49_9BILA|nr:hypothetical protein QR680_018728 [Steinernema hermaphroditum]